jgi:hypothetical protein
MIRLNTRRTSMARNATSGIYLPDLGPGTGLAILGFRAHVFGCSDCCCAQSGFNAALGREADRALTDLLVLTRMIRQEGQRRVSISAPGCGRVTEDEVCLARALLAAQAWDERALERHLSCLLAGTASSSLITLVTQIADTFAGHGLAFHVPAHAKVIPAKRMPLSTLSQTSRLKRT